MQSSAPTGEPISHPRTQTEPSRAAVPGAPAGDESTVDITPVHHAGDTGADITHPPKAEPLLVDVGPSDQGDTAEQGFGGGAQPDEGKADAAPPPQRPKKEKLKATDSVKSRNLKRRIVVVSVVVAAVALLGSFVFNAINPPPSADEVAASVTDSIFADEQFSPFVSTGAQFLEAYLMPAVTREEVDARQEQLSLLTAGLGGNWVTGQTPAGKVFKIVRGPYISGEPRTVSPALVPRSVTIPYQVWMQAPNGTLTRSQYSVAVASSVNSDTGIFTVYVPIPPSLVAMEPVEKQDRPDPERDSQVTAAATPQLEQFLQLWAEFDSETATDAQKTNLMSYLATGISRSAVSGLSGVVSFQSLDSVALTPNNPENPTEASGLITVTWKSSSTGVEYAASYQIAMVNEANRWLVQSITPLGGP